MRVTLRFHHTEGSPELTAHSQDRIHAALNRFGSQVKSVHVRFGAEQGLAGSDGVTCTIQVSGPVLGTVVVHELGLDPLVAVDYGMARVARVLQRRLARHRGDYARRRISA